MTAHPLAEIFPLLNGAELDALVEDVRANGLREPIVTLDGKVLDGRNRLRACELAGVTPRFEEPPTGTEPLAYVLSKNLARRHLSVSQRALIAAQLANLDVGRPTETASIEAITQSEAADRLSVSRSSVQRAAMVAEKGVIEVIVALQQGKLKLHTAREIADLPPDLQRDAVNPPAPTTRPIDPRVEKILRKQERPKRTKPKPPAPVAPQTPSAPPPFRTFAARIADSLRDEIDYVNQHELCTITTWTTEERATALRLLTDLRGQIDALIAAVIGGAA